MAQKEKIPEAFKKKRSVSSIIGSIAGLILFALAAYMIYRQLSKYTFEQVKSAIFGVSATGYLFAVLAMFASYFVLAFYDFLALQYIHKRSILFRWLMAGATGFAVSNNTGHAYISGAITRYHLYKRWGFTIPDIVKMVFFSSLTYIIGCFFLLVVGFAITPSGAIGNISHHVTIILVIISIAFIAAYLTASLTVKKPITIRSIPFRFPPFKLALSQILIGSLDVILASLVLYSVLYGSISTPFTTFIGIFLVSQTLGVFSPVPGGVGVFEGIFFYVMTNSAHEAELPLIAGLIVYRVLYYFIPLFLSMLAVFIYEARFRYGRQRIIDKWKKLKKKLAVKK